MVALAFDTLTVSKRLKATGLSEAQAEAIAEEMKTSHDINFEHLATKSDLRELELRVINRIGVMIIGLGAFLAAMKFFG